MNIPTAELGALAEQAQTGPQMLRYPRDPSLDPQLVWKGKDEQDGQDLVVPAIPIHIQEQISPKAIIEDLREASAGRRERQLDMFSADFNGMPFAERVEFYRHPMKWSNRMILGDSLQVMCSLAEKEGLKGQVQMIYVDPPYGIKFGSNWQVSTRKRDVTDGKAEDATRQPEQISAFRDTWKEGVNSYLSYLRDRLVVARELLTASGSIFVQIGDENVHLVRSLLDEVFGTENFVAIVSYSKTTGATADLLPGTLDFLVWYAKSRDAVKFRRLYSEKALGGSGAGKYDQLEERDGTRRSLETDERGNGIVPAGARVYRLDNLLSQSMGREKGEGAASWFPVRIGGVDFRPNMRSRWKTNESGMSRLVAANRIQVTGNTLAYVRFLEDFPAYPISNAWMDIGGIQSRADPKIYVVQTATTAIQRCLLMTSDPGDLVLDPTCGSGTTAYAAEEWGRRWITIDTSRVALALARTRLMAAKYPHYLMADTPEGQRKEADLTGQMPIESTAGDIRKGFVYERVPHVTLKSIAQNPDIHEGMTRAEIDAAIAKHAETEILFDRPYSDNKVVRVAGPFTVESLSPHRVVADGPEDLVNPPAPVEESGRFVETILANLRTSGVDNRTKGERLRFLTLDPFAGRFIQATGTYTEGETERRVAVAIGPQYGTVGPELVQEAAVEAGGYFDLLVVCGFAFDARADEETGKAMRFGKLTVLTVRMNPDLSMGEDLLKKTRTGNLFTIFGQPDVDIRRVGDGQLQVEIRGLDTYNPTNGEVVPQSTADIACWFIDTAYDNRQFFVRHAYFLGDDDPYDKLRRALRADIDEAAWSSLNSTVSRPFPIPDSGCIAIKVINHYGDEILKVYQVRG
ncbi:MAG: site-specific DNA-methyltransferase [Candidatus Limnocylindrales bacterium]